MRYRLDGTGLETENDDWWIAPNAVVIGKVRLEVDASVWWGAVLRGDNEPIIVGRGSNVQDGTICHTDPGTPLVIGPYVTVGHMAMLHGCTLEDDVLIGIKATVLNGAIVRRHTLLGAHALIAENKDLPGGNLITGAPARVVRPLDERGLAAIARGASSYVANWKRYAAEMKPGRLDRRV